MTFYGKYKHVLSTSDYHSLILGNFTGCDWRGETWSCCSSSQPCGMFEGDCDGDEECTDNLVCGLDNCFSSFPSLADCCIEP